MDGSAEGLDAVAERSKTGVIPVTASTLVDLRAEVYLAQQRVVQEQHDPTLRARARAKARKPPSWLIKQKKNKGVADRKKRDKADDLDERERRSMAMVAAKLAAKAKLYEKMMQGTLTQEEQETFLVDFERKQLEVVGLFADGKLVEGGPRTPTPPPANAGEEWVDYVDAFGRRRRCMKQDLPRLQAMDRGVSEEEARRGPTLLSDDMRREMERQEWEARAMQEMEEERPVGPVHYQDVRAKEVRTLGTGYFAFSTDEDERAKQLHMLATMRDETISKRGKRDRLKARREKRLQQRLDRIKRRKLGADPSAVAEDEAAADADPETAPKPEAGEESSTATDAEGEVPGGDSDEPVLSTVDELLAFYRKAVEASEGGAT